MHYSLMHKQEKFENTYREALCSVFEQKLDQRFFISTIFNFTEPFVVFESIYHRQML